MLEKLRNLITTKVEVPVRGVELVNQILGDFETKRNDLKVAMEDIDSSIDRQREFISNLEQEIDDKLNTMKKARNAVDFLTKITGE